MFICVLQAHPLQIYYLHIFRYRSFYHASPERFLVIHIVLYCSAVRVDYHRRDGSRHQSHSWRDRSTSF